MWHYLYFMHYLRLKDPDDLNGAEHFVHAQILINEPSFFPIGRSLMMERQKAEDGEDEEAASAALAAGGDVLAADAAGQMQAQMRIVMDRLEAISKAVERPSESPGTPAMFGGGSPAPQGLLGASFTEMPARRLDPMRPDPNSATMKQKRRK
jgi:hypothetical protein